MLWQRWFISAETGNISHHILSFDVLSKADWHGAA